MRKWGATVDDEAEPSAPPKPPRYAEGWQPRAGARLPSPAELMEADPTLTRGRGEGRPPAGSALAPSPARPEPEQESDRDRDTVAGPPTPGSESTRLADDLATLPDDGEDDGGEGDELSGAVWEAPNTTAGPLPADARRPDDAPALDLPRRRSAPTPPQGAPAPGSGEGAASAAPAPGPPAGPPAWSAPDLGDTGEGDASDLPSAEPLPSGDAPPPEPPREPADSDPGRAGPAVDLSGLGAASPVLTGDDASAAFMAGSTAAPAAAPAPATSADLTDEALLRPMAPVPETAFGRAVSAVTGGRVRWESRAERRRRALRARAAKAVSGHRHQRVAVVSLKGGVGKTTTTMVLGQQLATLRGDRIIALDANPDHGTLRKKVRTETTATVRDLLAERNAVLASGYQAMRGFTTQSETRLEVLISDTDATTAFTAADYSRVAEVLEKYYSVLLTDTGTNMTHDALVGHGGVLDLAHQMVLVSGPALDEATTAAAMLDKLEAQGRGDLVRHSVVAINCRSGVGADVELSTLVEHFRRRCAGVVVIPQDPHLGRGSVIDLEQLHSAAREAVLELAALVGDQFAARSA